MKKILLINNGYPSKTNPQYSTYIKSIYECLVQADLEVELLTLDTNFTSKKEKILNYLTYYKKLFFKNYSKYDNIYIHNYPHSFLPLIFKLPQMPNLTIHWHGTDIFPASKTSGILNKLSYLFLPKTAKHMVPSEYFVEMVSQTLGIDKNKIFVSPSGGIDTDIFRPIQKEKSNQIVLGFASSMRTDKGMDYVLKLMQQSQNLENATGKSIKLLCIGYGAEKEFYSTELAKLNNVQILSPLPKNQMVGFYQEIDLLLLLSTRMAESLALVGLEAMSCNVPVVGTNDFAIKNYVINGLTGEKFDKGDYISFKNSVIQAIKNIENYNPRDIVVKDYSRKHVIEQYKQYFGDSDE